MRNSDLRYVAAYNGRTTLAHEGGVLLLLMKVLRRFRFLLMRLTDDGSCASSPTTSPRDRVSAPVAPRMRSANATTIRSSIGGPPTSAAWAAWTHAVVDSTAAVDTALRRGTAHFWASGRCTGGSRRACAPVSVSRSIVIHCTFAGRISTTSPCRASFCSVAILPDLGIQYMFVYPEIPRRTKEIHGTARVSLTHSPSQDYRAVGRHTMQH